MSYSSRVPTKPRQPLSAQPRVSRPERHSLSQAMNQYPRYCEEKKITLVEKSVTLIDDVPKRFAGVEMLLLSNNLVRELGRVDQFRALKSLSLANNKIENLTQLIPLGSLKSLEMLYFEGNPVAQLPTYRDFLLDLLPSLRSLDSQEVTEQERTQAKLNLKQLTRILDLLIKNEEEGTKLEHLRRLLLVHQELIHKGAVRGYQGVVVGNYLKWVGVEWPESVRLMVQDTFESKAKQILRRNRGKDWLWAYTQNLMEQQQIIARLMILCEQGSKETLEVFITRETMFHSLQSSKKPRQSHTGKASISDGRQVRSLSIPESPKALSSPTTSQPRTPTKQEQIALFPEETKQGQTETRPKSPTSSAPNVLTASEAQQPSVQKQLHLENEILRRKLTEYSKASKQSDAETQELVQQLMNKVEQLTIQCGEYEKDKSHSENKLSIAIARNAVLEERNATLTTENGIGEAALGPQVAKSEFCSVSKAVRMRMLQFETIKSWKRHHQTAKEAKIIHQSAEIRLNSEILSGIWRNWHLAFVSSVHRRMSTLAHQKRAALLFFKQFKQTKRRQTRLNRILDRVNARRKATGFSAFRTFPVLKSNARARKATAQEHYSSYLFLRALNGWRTVTQSWVVPVDRLATIEELSTRIRRCKLMQSLWNVWVEWRGRFGTKRYQSLVVANDHYRRHLKRFLIRILKLKVEFAVKSTASADSFREKTIFDRANTCLKALKTAVAMGKVKTHLTNLAECHYQARLLIAFHRGTQLAASEEKSITFAKVASRLILFRRAMKGWKAVISRFKRIKEAEKEMKIRVLVRRMRGYMMKWALAIVHPKYRQEKKNLVVERDVVSGWMRFAILKRAKRYRMAIGNRLFVRNKRQKTGNFVKKWRLFAAKRKTERKMTQKLQNSLDNRMYLRYYTSWRCVYSLSLLARAEVKLHESQKEQRLCAIVRSQASDLATQAQDLTLKLTEKEAEVANVKAELSDLKQSYEAIETLLKSSENEVEKLENEAKQYEIDSENAKTRFEHQIESYEGQLKSTFQEIDSQRSELAHKGESLQSAFEHMKSIQNSLQTRIADLETENLQLKTELKSRDEGIEYTERLSLTLKTGLDKATKVLGSPLPTDRLSASQHIILNTESTPKMYSSTTVVHKSPPAARSYSGPNIFTDSDESENPEVQLEILQREKAKIQERLLAKSKNMKESVKAISIRSSPRSGSEDR